MDAFNKTISSGGGGNSAPKKVTKEDVKKAKADLKDNAKEILAAAPKVSAETIKKQIDDAIAGAKEEWNREQAIKELTGIGAKANPNYGKDGQQAVATSFGFRFYGGNRALRIFDKTVGDYNVKENTFSGDDGSKDILSNVMRTGIPSKFAVAFAKFNNSPGVACKDYIGWDPGTISILNKAFEITYKKSLDKHLANKLSTVFGSVDDNIDAFRKKFASVLS